MCVCVCIHINVYTLRYYSICKLVRFSLWINGSNTRTAECSPIPPKQRMFWYINFELQLLFSYNRT